MHQPPDIIGAFNDRIRRHVIEALRQYRRELRSVAAQMAASGRHNSGAHLKRRIEVLRKAMVELTDQCFEDVTHLPGNQPMHRSQHANFLLDELGRFLNQAQDDVLVFDPGSAASTAIRQELQTIREGLEHDLQDFRAQLWRPRSPGRAPTVTNNTVNVHSSNVGSIQQAGEGSTQSATTNMNIGAIQTALDEFVSALENSDVTKEVRNAAMIEVETIRPQLKKTTPSATIVREGLQSLRTILEGAIGGVVASKLTALLIAAGISMAS